MKKVSLILVALAFFSASVASAAVLPSEEVEKNPTSEQIRVLLENPNFDVTHEMKAKVTFMLNEDHEIVVISVDTEDKIVDKFVKNRLNYKKIESLLKEGQEYTVPITIQAAT